MTACQIVRKEFDLEQSSVERSELSGLVGVLVGRGVPFSFFATAAAVLVDMRLRSGRFGEALVVTAQLLGRMGDQPGSAFERLSVALRATALVAVGRVAEAESTWTRHGLPEDTEGCLNRGKQNWRVLEAVAEARVRLLTAAGRYDQARCLVEAYLELAARRPLRKTRMRALALSVALEKRAGETAAAERRLMEYLDLFDESPYSWALVRERTAVQELLSRLVESNPGTPRTRSARTLLEAMLRIEETGDATLSGREREVLRLLENRRVKEVAVALGLSVHGVRYHLRGLFRKLDVRNQAQLLQRARELGLLADGS